MPRKKLLKFYMYFPHPLWKPAFSFGLCKACSRLLHWNYMPYEKLFSSHYLIFPLSSTVWCCQLKKKSLPPFKPVIILQVVIKEFCGRLGHIYFSEVIYKMDMPPFKNILSSGKTLHGNSTGPTINSTRNTRSFAIKVHWSQSMGPSWRTSNLKLGIEKAIRQGH